VNRPGRPGLGANECAGDTVGFEFSALRHDLDKVYLVPIEVVASHKREMWLRLEPSRNGQVSRTNLAEKFLLVPDAAA